HLATSLEEHPLSPWHIEGESFIARNEPSIVDVRVDRSTRHRTSRRGEDDVEVSRIRIRVGLRPRPVVSKFEEPEMSRRPNDRTADLLPDLTRQGIEQRLRSVPASPWQHVGPVFVEHEDRPARPR